MWHILKLEYTAADSTDPKTQMTGYGSLEQAGNIFDHLELGYQLGTTVRLKGGKRIRIGAIELYESFKQRLDDAVEHVKSGDATLMREAREVDLEIAG
jgi:hypothetical protein